MSKILKLSGALAALALGASAIAHFRSAEASQRKSSPRAEIAEEAAPTAGVNSEPLVTRYAAPIQAARAPQRAQPAANPVDPEPPAVDQVAVLAGNLQTAFNSEPPPDGTSMERTREMRTLIDSDEFRKNGSKLVSLACSKNICRGELESASAEADLHSTERAFLSTEFAQKFPMAIAVPERTKEANGAVHSTFYVYDPRVLEGVPN